MEGNNSNDSVDLAVNLGEGAVASQLNVSVPDERALFEKRWKYLDFARNHDAWGREQYAYAGVQSMWQGWLSRAEAGVKSNSPQAT